MTFSWLFEMESLGVGEEASLFDSESRYFHALSVMKMMENFTKLSIKCQVEVIKKYWSYFQIKGKIHCLCHCLRWELMIKCAKSICCEFSFYVNSSKPMDYVRFSNANFPSNKIAKKLEVGSVWSTFKYFNNQLAITKHNNEYLMMWAHEGASDKHENLFSWIWCSRRWYDALTFYCFAFSR